MASSNEILQRTVTCYHAFIANPQLHPFMQPALRKSLETLAREIEQVLPAHGSSGASVADAVSIEEAFAATRSALGRLQHCIRGWYAEDESVLRKLGPLTLGDDAGQDLIRLTHLASELPKIKAPDTVFVFPPDLVPAKLRAILSAHSRAAAQSEAESKSQQAIHKKQMALRPQAHALWRTAGLDAWVQANLLTYEGQIAFGRERRRKPRKAAEHAANSGSGTGSGAA